MATYQIIPADHRKVGQPGAAMKYPFGEMLEGDRFHVPLEGRDAKAVMVSLCGSARSMGLMVACRRISGNRICVVMLGSDLERTA